jgi:hypothetical protein
MLLRRYLTQIAAAAVVASALSLTACGGVDGIDLNGKMFDWLGVSSASQEGRTREPKMADRAPLVVPPDVKRLPEPGSGQTTSSDVAALNDPDRRKQAAAKERERLHLAYCRGEIQWKEKALNPQQDGGNRSPYGPCPGLFTGSINNLTK